jgi:23S rRNA (pseudouridine1915-N3)-methyltransferase
MSLKPLHIIAVGRPRTVFWREASAHYLERLGRWRNLTETFVKDAEASLPSQRKIAEEGKRILEAVTQRDITVCLDEKGKSMASREFSIFLDALSQDATRRPCFIIGGPFGLDDSVRSAACHLISFGPQTLPHELARVVLLEQLYRAESILRNTPYHHE